MLRTWSLVPEPTSLYSQEVSYPPLIRMKRSTNLTHSFAVRSCWSNLQSHCRRLALTSLALCATSLHAQTISGIWSSNSGGNWSDPTRWSSNPDIPGGEGATVSITSNFSSGGKTIVIDGVSRTAGIVHLGDSDSGSALTLSASGGASLIFNGAGSSNAQINKNAGAADTISAPLTLDSALDVSNNDDSDLTLSGQITGSSGIAIGGSGRTVFTGTVANSSFSGGVTLNSGTLGVGTPLVNVLGSGPLTLRGGTFHSLTASNLLTVGQNLNLDGNLRVTSGSGGVTFSGAATVNGDLTINATSGATSNSRNTTFNNISAGTGNIVFNASAAGNATGQGVRIGAANYTGTLTNGSTGTGWVVVTGALGSNITGVIQDSTTSTMRLQGNNTYTSTTQVKAGVLEVTGTINSSSGVSISGGAFHYGNNTTGLSRDVTVTGGEFKYNSTQAYTGALTFISGIISGSGNLSGTALTLGAGRTLSPGNSPGTLNTGAQTWGAGGTYLWEINALATSVPAGAEGAATGWDVAVINGPLTITAGPGQFNLVIDSLVPLNNWNNTGSYQWRIATASGGVTGFDPAAFNIDTTQFAAENPLGAGSFHVTNVGNNVYLNFSPVPEPSVSALVAIAGLTLILRRRYSSTLILPPASPVVGAHRLNRRPSSPRLSIGRSTR